MNEEIGEITPDIQQLVTANNLFAVDLYSHLASNMDGGLFFSPSSISLAFAMAYAGAGDDTASEIADVMHFQLPPERLHEAMKRLQQDTRKGGVELRIANRFWGQGDYRFLADFLQITEEFYGAPLVDADFVGAAENTRMEINDWVANQTGQKIKDLIPSGSFNEFTRLVLANAIYFLGSWDNEFEEDETVDADFRVTTDQTHSTRMMRQTDYFRYGDFDDMQVLEMPYRSRTIELKTVNYGEFEGQEEVEIPGGGSDFAMTFFLPRKVDGIRDLETQLSVATIQKWTTLRSCEVSVQIPKFRMESTHLLNEALQALGMEKSFLIDKANFSGMSDNPEGLFIGAAIHKAFVDVNEKGTEAAAATAMMMAGGCAMEPDPPKEFIANHPFVFMIRDRRTRQIHFMGRVCSPRYQD